MMSYLRQARWWATWFKNAIHLRYCAMRSDQFLSVVIPSAKARAWLGMLGHPVLWWAWVASRLWAFAAALPYAGAMELAWAVVVCVYSIGLAGIFRMVCCYDSSFNPRVDPEGMSQQEIEQIVAARPRSMAPAPPVGLRADQLNSARSAAMAATHVQAEKARRLAAKLEARLPQATPAPPHRRL